MDLTMLYYVDLFRLTSRLVNANMPYFGQNWAKYVGHACWTICGPALVHLPNDPCLLFQIIDKKWVKFFVIFGPNLAFTTWAGLGSPLFCPGQKNAYSVRSEVLMWAILKWPTSVCYLGSKLKCRGDITTCLLFTLYKKNYKKTKQNWMSDIAIRSPFPHGHVLRVCLTACFYLLLS